MASEHLIGLLLGTEEDWPGAFEAIVGGLGDISYRGETHRLVTERVTNARTEGFNRIIKQVKRVA